jgi:hypothetical protein
VSEEAGRAGSCHSVISASASRLLRAAPIVLAAALGAATFAVGAQAARFSPLPVPTGFAGIQATVSGLTTRVPLLLPRARLLEHSTQPPGAPAPAASLGTPVVNSVSTVEGEGPSGELLEGPSEGPSSGGTEVRISGEHLDDCSIVPLTELLSGSLTGLACQQVIVHFGGEPALVLAAFGTEILAYTPSSVTEGAVYVTVTTPGGTSLSGVGDQYVYAAPRYTPPAAPQPAISEVTPAEGPATGFTPVAVRGTNLLPPGVEQCVACAGVVVLFNGTAVPVLEGTPGELQVVSPPAAPGPVNVQVRVGAEASRTAEADRFTYLQPTPPDTTPPRVTVTQPAAGSVTTSSTQTIAGEAGVEPGDLSVVTVTLFNGSTAAALESHQVQAVSGHWSTTFAGLSPGAYAVRAEQSDEAGNRGASEPVAFSVVRSAAPPAASFTWFPREPRVAEPVTLVSNSIDAKSPITAFAWSLGPSAPFQTGGPSLTTTFFTAGAHQVQLRVANAAGETTTASESIAVSSPKIVLMQPFPVVRIVGTDNGSGATLSLLSVQAPSGAVVTVVCKGRGCPVKRVRRVVPRRRSGSATVSFPQFARRLPAGVVLLVRVQEPGEIGKYTRFVVRRGKVPARVDGCLAPTATNPMACPTS